MTKKYAITLRRPTASGMGGPDEDVRIVEARSLKEAQAISDAAARDEGWTWSLKAVRYTEEEMT